MVLKVKGKSHLISSYIVGKVTRDTNSSNKSDILICENDIPNYHLSSFKALITPLALLNLPDKPLVYNVASVSHLTDGDIIVIHSDGTINTLYRTESQQNFLLVTERCNSNCLMCSQPPRDKDDILYKYNIHNDLIKLIPNTCSSLGITGGEPTLMGDYFFKLLESIKSKLPDTELHCLTNGRSFAWNNITNKLGEINYNRLTLAIPLYSDYSYIHDYIVQAENAFDQTIKGLYNLATHNQRIEIRIVLHKQSIPRLVKLAKYIYRNLPFVEHITFMGLEYQGYTPFNFDKLWINPVDYMSQLREATDFLSSRLMNVSIYNLQHCLLDESLWKYSRRSISDWKNVYVKECSKCEVLEECGGLFASNSRLENESIKAIVRC